MAWKGHFSNAISHYLELQAAMGATALQHIRNGMDREHRMVQSLDRLGIQAMGGKYDESDNMPGDVHIGDVTNEAPQPNPLAKYGGMALLTMALAGPLAYLGGKYLDRPVAAPTEDKDTVVGLTILEE